MFSILLAAGQDHSVVINDLKHMPGKLLTARWRRLASILASASVVAPKRRVSRMATVSPAVLVATLLAVNAIAVLRAEPSQTGSGLGSRFAITDTDLEQ
jgi:hypothetical protein